MSEVWSCSSSMTSNGFGFCRINTPEMVQWRRNVLPVLQCKSKTAVARLHQATCWDLVNLEQTLVSAGSRGSGFGHPPRLEDLLQAEVRRLAAENDEMQRNAAQQTPHLRQQGCHATISKQDSNMHCNGMKKQLKIRLTQPLRVPLLSNKLR